MVPRSMNSHNEQVCTESSLMADLDKAMLMFLGLSLSRARTQNKTLFEDHRVPGNFPIDPSAGWIMDAAGPLRVRKIFHNGARKSTRPSAGAAAQHA